MKACMLQYLIEMGAFESAPFNNLEITKIKKKAKGRGGKVDKLEFTFEPEKVPKIEQENY